MAKRAKGKSMPGALAQGSKIYPIVPYRALVSLTAVATNEREVLDFDLQFENNEVMDIFSLEYLFSIDFDDVDAYNELNLNVALFDDPDKDSATDIDSETVFEDDASLIHYMQHQVVCDLATSGMALAVVSGHYPFTFPQPYTVGRNVCMIADWEGTEAGVKNPECKFTLWGRRRVASDSEFKNIIYRQRF